MTSRFLLPLLLLLALFVPATQAAEAFQPYTPERFAQLQREGKVVLVDVYAPWCPTCRAQAPVMTRLLQEKPFADIVALRLDWDDQRALAKQMGAPRQSTFFVFRGGQKLGTSVAETNETRLRMFLSTSLAKPAGR